jgi:urease accessory protein
MRVSVSLITLSLAVLPGMALAHPGHEAGSVLSGMMHPVGGMDHLLAMVALGLLAGQAGNRAIWALPLAFVAAMLAGGAAGFGGIAFPAVEPMILASIIVLGVLVALARPVPLAALLAMVAVFGAAHGWAHGAEGPATGMAAYAFGFALMTAVLHGAGIALAAIAGRLAPVYALRGLGGMAALAGFGLMVG